VKLRALAKLCSVDFFDDRSLLVVAWKRILEVLELAMPEEKKVRGGKGTQQRKKTDPRKQEILDACAALGLACQNVHDWNDAERYAKRAKEGYEEQLGRESEKALEATYSLTMSTDYGKRIEKLGDLVKRIERALGEENVVTLDTLNTLGAMLNRNGEYEGAIKICKRFLAGRMKLLGEDHRETFETLNNLGGIYKKMENYENALGFFERVLKANEGMLGTNHPHTLVTMMNIANMHTLQMDFGKAEPLYEIALEGFEAQLGKDHSDTKRCAKDLGAFCEFSGNEEKLAELRKRYAL